MPGTLTLSPPRHLSTTPTNMNETKPQMVLSMAEIVGKSPDPVAAIKALGASIAKSQMLGPTDRAEIGEVVVMLCLTEGLTLGELFRSHQMSFGRLERRIDSGMAEFKARGGKIEWVSDGSDGQQARARFILGNETVEASCSVDEAKKAGWTKNAKWLTEPQTMLRARVKKRGLVALCPDIFFGEYDSEDRPQADVTIDAGKMAAAAAVAPRVTQPSAPAPTAPAPAPAPTSAPFTAPAKSLSESLTEKLQEQLVSVIGADRIADAQAWAVSVGWLTVGQSIEELPEKHAKAILAKPERFNAALTAFIAKQGGAK